jgi:hypothetical protein
MEDMERIKLELEQNPTLSSTIKQAISIIETTNTSRSRRKQIITSSARRSEAKLDDDGTSQRTIVRERARGSEEDQGEEDQGEEEEEHDEELTNIIYQTSRQQFDD